MKKFFIVLFSFIALSISFSNAEQLFAYTKNIATKDKKDELSWIFDSGIYYTDFIEVSKNGFSGDIKFLIMSNFNCSPGNIFIYDGGQYQRFQTSYNQTSRLCTSPVITLSDSSSFKFFYSSTQNIGTNTDVQLVMVDLDSFNNSVKPFSTGFSASVSIPTSCPVIDSEYCQINGLCSVIDENYCKNNFGLINPSECIISGTGDIQWSALFIDNIQHLGAPIIRIDIPSEIEWDYSRNDTEFNLTISGYNVDTDYIEGIINIQNSSPTTDDFSNIFGAFGYFGGLLVACLFVIFVFYIIKKIF